MLAKVTDTQEESGETITEILCRISYPFLMLYNGYNIVIHVYDVGLNNYTYDRHMDEFIDTGL